MKKHDRKRRARKREARLNPPSPTKIEVDRFKDTATAALDTFSVMRDANGTPYFTVNARRRP